jgi:hypothetical protein
MLSIGFSLFALIILLPLVACLTVVPWIVGFAYILPDANRRGQPGALWALLTLPLSWLAVLVYLAVRAGTPPRA